MRTWVIIFAMFSFGVHLHGDYDIVVGKTFPAEEISSTTLKRLFLGHVSIVGGERIVLHQIEGKALKLFCETQLKVSLSSYERRWARRIFTGKGRVPRTFKSAKKMLSALLREGNGLGFVKAGTALPDGLRTVRITEK